MTLYRTASKLYPLTLPIFPPRVVIALIAAATLAGCARAEHHQRRKRVVTLTPSSTEIVAAVGGPDLIVGIDKYSVYPAQIRDRPVVGDFLNPSFEAILALRPDLAVVDTVQMKVADGLRAAGIETLVLDMHTIADVRTGIARVGKVLDATARADELISALDRDIAAVARRGRARSSPRPRVLAVVDRRHGGLGAVVAAGPGSYIDELLAVVGARNVMEASTVRYSNITAEQILRGQPDIILDSIHDDSGRAQRDWAMLATVPAVANQRIHGLADPIYRSPSPRVGHALLGLEAIIDASADDVDVR